jgi:hypothetical protein
MAEAVYLERRGLASTLATRTGIVVFLAALGFLLRYWAFRMAIPDGDFSGYLKVMCRWDCEWYVGLAERGYDPFPTPRMINAANWAFFPLYPMTIGLLHHVTGIATIPLAAAISTFTCAVTALVAWPLLGKNLRAFTLFAAFLLAGPFSFYFTTFFTETLFMALTVAVFAALRGRHYLLAGLLAAGLSATRIVGVFIVFAILWEIWSEHRERGGTWRDFVPAILGRPEIILAFAIAPSGLFAYMLFLHLHIGDALAFQHVQRAWGRVNGLPPVFIWNGLMSFPREGWWPTASQWLGLASVVGYALTLGLFLRRWVGMGIYSAIALTLPLFAGLASMTRFVAGLAPMSLLAADLLGRQRISFALGLLAILIGAWYGTFGWLDWNLALV